MFTFYRKYKVKRVEILSMKVQRKTLPHNLITPMNMISEENIEHNKHFQWFELG